MALDEEKLGLLEKAVKMIKEYGFLNLLKAFFLVVLIAFFCYNFTTFNSAVKSAVEKYSTESVEAHSAALGIRKDIQSNVDGILDNALETLGCDRAFVMEMHNGTNNASGLPFSYVCMTYEAVADGIEYIAEDYDNLNLTRFSFPYYIEESRTWCGSIERLEDIDGKLSKRMASNGVTYMAVSMLSGIDCELGYFGITYCDGKEPADSTVMMRTVISSAQKLSTLLDINAHYNTK